MRLAHWFANFYPPFHVSELETYLKVYGPDEPLTPENLARLGSFRSANYLYENQAAWRGFVARVEDYIDNPKDIKTVFWGDKNFPTRLKNLSIPPAVLFYVGELTTFEERCVSVVGARHPTDLGRLWVKEMIPLLVQSGLVVISGGARGIDLESHWAALTAGGRSIAFLPSGLDNPYPSSNRFLFERIKITGALCSEYLPGTAVRSENFHRRNRLIACAADGVIIVEAAEKSGTIMTAGKARDEGRDVLVVPGPPQIPTYAGSNLLIREGATLVRDAQDVIAALPNA